MKPISFLPYQQKVMESTKREILLSGGMGTGKSYVLCCKLVFLLMRYERTRAFLGRRTLQSLKSSTLKTLLDGDGNLPPALPERFIQSHNRTDRLVRLVNGSELYYGNLDINFLKSTNLAYAGIDEATEVDVDTYNVLMSRLRMDNTPLHQCVLVTNPAGENHWLYNRFAVNPPTDIHGKINSEFIQSATSENTYLPIEYTDSLKKILFGTWLQRYYYGIWCANENVVYDNFNPTVHIISNFDIPLQWIRVRGFDFGYKSPFSCLWCAIAGSDCKQYNDKLEPGDLIVYKELYYTERTADVNAKRVVAFSKYYDENEKFLWNVADHDASDRASLEAEGIKTIPAIKDITFGIQKVRERFGNSDPSRGLIVRPRLYIFENTLVELDPKIRIDPVTGMTNTNPVKLTDELSVYSWKKNPTKKLEEPEDSNNHSADCLRYVVMALDYQKQWKDIEFKSL